MSRTEVPITVVLGDLKEQLEARVESGEYASASEVLRAAIRALEREEAAVNDWLRERVDEALADPRPNIPAREVFAGLRAQHAEQLKTKGNEEA